LTAIASLLAIYLAVPIILGVNGRDDVYQWRSFRSLPLWRELFITAWEASGHEGKPRILSERARRMAEERDREATK
jgi:hypothetical protein